MKPITMIVTASGAPGAPSIISSLRDNGERPIRIVTTDMNGDAYGLRVGDRGYVVPPGHLPSYAAAMLDIAEKEAVDVVLPLSTYELLPLSRNLGRFESIGARVMVSRTAPLQKVLDKYALLRYLRKKGVDVPDFGLAGSLSQFEKCAQRLGYPEKTICFKPRFGKGGRGFRILREDVDRVDVLLNQKAERNIYVTLPEILKVLSRSNPFPQLLLLEYLPGEEYSVDLLLEHGEPLDLVCRRRDEIKLGICSVGTVVDDRDVSDNAISACRELKLDYNINVQERRSEDGVPAVLEINPRVSGTIVLCHAAGINMVYLGVKLALGEGVPHLVPACGTRMIRYWKELFIGADGVPFTLPRQCSAETSA